MNLGHFPNFEIVDVAMAVSRWKIVEPGQSWKVISHDFSDPTELRKQVLGVFHIHERNQAFILHYVWSSPTRMHIHCFHYTRKYSYCVLCFVFFFIFESFLLEKTLESPLDSMIKPVNPKGNQPWIFIGRTDAEAPKLWPSDVNSRLTGKDPDTGKDWGKGEKEVTKDEIVGWHHWLNGHEFEQAPGDSEGQGSLACCSPWGCK